MRKAADLIKKQIVQVDTGNIIGSVADLLLDPEKDRLVAVLTVTARWLREPALIPWEQIIVSTGDVILVHPGTEPVHASINPRLQELLERNIHVSGTPVLTRSGAKIGSVGELLIDDQGRIKGYVINSGFLGSERQFVAAENVEALGSDALIIHEGSVSDTLPTSEPELADELKHSIVLPLTGTRLTVEQQGSGSESETLLADSPMEANEQAAIVAPEAPGVEPVPESASPTGQPPLPFTGVTQQRSTDEVDALRGEQPTPDATKTDFD